MSNESPDKPNSPTAQQWLDAAKLQQEGRSGRRSAEWKLAIEFWGFAVAVPVVVGLQNAGVLDKLKSGECISIFLLYVLAGVAFVLSDFATHQAHAKDRQFIAYYLERLEKVPQQCPDSEPRPKDLNLNGWLWFASKGIFTFVVLCASYKLVQAKMPSSTSSDLPPQQQPKPAPSICEPQSE